MMETKELTRVIAKLESVNDQLESERDTMDRLLRESGFPHGLESFKSVAEEILSEDEAEESQN